MGNSAVILIIPSASYRTGPFMNAIKKLDLKVLVISDKSQVFSGKYPDNLIIINFNHWKDKSVEISKWAKNNGLKAVIGVDEESIVLAANLSNFLNVDHNSIESVLLTKNKYLMRTELKKTGLCSPWFKIFSIYESSNKIINEISLPCVIKPTFLSGSRGVMRVNTKKELLQFCKKTNLPVVASWAGFGSIDNKIKNHRIVIDTKFTNIFHKKSSWYREKSLKSGYIYQLYAYLRSQEGLGEKLNENSSGMLLHPAIGEDVDESATIQGHEMRFSTVDLTQPHEVIKNRLLSLVS